MSIEKVHEAVRKVVDLVSEQRYAEALALCVSSRLTKADLAGVMQSYGMTFVPTSGDFLKLLDAVPIKGSSPPAWSIRSPLWTLEEGRSDLTLELTVTDEGQNVLIELDDLRVL